jgi:hypothetical protein
MRNARVAFDRERGHDLPTVRGRKSIALEVADIDEQRDVDGFVGRSSSATERTVARGSGVSPAAPLRMTSSAPANFGQA